MNPIVTAAEAIRRKPIKRNRINKARLNVSVSIFCLINLPILIPIIAEIAQNIAIGTISKVNTSV